jgi:hypothetical protein
MKKAVILLIIMLGMMLGQVQATTPGKPAFSLAIGAGVRNFSGDEEGVHSTFNLAFSLDVAYRFGRSIAVFVHTDYVSSKGELSLTKEETTLTIIPVEAGARYLFKGKNFIPYIGAGIGLYSIKEENPIGTVEENGFGFFAELGTKIYMQYFFFDIKAKYLFLSITPVDESKNLGGFYLLAGVGYSF